MIEILVTDNEGRQSVAGHFRIQGGKVVASDTKLNFILISPCYVGKREVTAQSSPVVWLNALPANYSGTRLRARKVG